MENNVQKYIWFKGDNEGKIDVIEKIDMLDVEQKLDERMKELGYTPEQQEKQRREAA